MASLPESDQAWKGKNIVYTLVTTYVTHKYDKIN